MCGHRFYGRHGRRFRNAETFFTIVVAMASKIIAVLARARAELEELSRGRNSGSAGHDLKPMETHPNVPL